MTHWRDRPDALVRCAEQARALLWRPDLEVAAVSAETAGRLGPLLRVAQGDAMSVRAAPATVFGPLLACGSSGVVLLHTHTDGRPPSAHDLAVTRRLVAAGALLGIPLRAHLVIGADSWVDCMAERAGPRSYRRGLDPAA